MNDDGMGRKWCEPDTVKAGRIVINRAIGRWSTVEAALAAVGNSWPPITANGKSVDVTGLTRSEPQWHTGVGTPPGWGFGASVQIQLAPNVYSLYSQWIHDVKSCTLTVTEP